MNKPISLIQREFKENLLSLINNSGLPLCISSPIVKDIYFEMLEKEEMAYQMDKQQYEDYMKSKDSSQPTL